VNNVSGQLLAENQNSLTQSYSNIYNSNYPQNHAMEVWVDIIDGQGCHFRNDHDAILLRANPQIMIYPLSAQYSCFYLDGDLPMTYLDNYSVEGGTPAFTYQWFKDGLPYSNSLAFTPDPLVPGLYTLKVTDAAGCQAISASNEILFVMKSPDPISGAQIEVCQGNPFSIFVQPYIPVPGNSSSSNGLGLVINQSNFEYPIQNLNSNGSLFTDGNVFHFQTDQLGQQTIDFQFVYRDLYGGPLIFNPNSTYAFSIPINVVPSHAVTEPNLNACSNITTNNTLENTFWAQNISSCPTNNVAVYSMASGRYFAGESIKLLPGFHADIQSDFIAKLQCVTTIEHRLEEEVIGDTTPARVKVSNGDFFTFYPNPSSGLLNFDLRLSKEKEYSIDLLDLTGRSIRTIQKGMGTGNVGIADLSDLAAGSYGIKLTISQSSLDQKVYKLIKLN
jgi:hypothetical protein